MKKAYFKYIFSLLLFGINGIVASKISLPSTQIVFWRTMIGSALLVVLFFASRQKITFHKNLKDTLFIALSGVAMGTSWMFLYEAYNQVGVSLASLTYYTGPVFVMVLSPFLFKEKLYVNTIISFAVVLLGIFFVNGSFGEEKLNPFGIFCGIMSAITYAAMVMFNKKSKNLQGLQNATIQLIVSFITLFVFIGIKTGFKITVAPNEWPWVLTLGILNTGIGCYLFFSSIGKLPVQTVAVCGYLEALSATVFAAVFLKEIMSPLQILGGGLIIGGAIFGEVRKNKAISGKANLDSV